jgi:peptidoglycan/LPS O-acetylase OafA/YrhL
LRIEQLTFTRFIAAIAIVIFHYGNGSFLFNNTLVSFIFKQANIGVSYFFILSGFVMIIAYHNNKTINFWTYLKNRFARVYPVYFLAILLTLVIYMFKDITLIDLFLNILMLQAWIPGKALTVNFPGWSLSVELFFYIAFPILFNYFYKNGYKKSIAYSILFIWLLSQFIFNLLVTNSSFIVSPFSKSDVYYSPLLHFNEFLIGNLAGLFFINKLKMKTGNYSIYIILLIIILILFLKFPFGLEYHNGFLSLVFVPLIILISLNRGKLNDILNGKLFIFLGEISFGIYILQRPVWKLISNHALEKYIGLDKVEDFTLIFFIRFFILILISSLSFTYFETPVRNKIKKIQLLNS